MNSLRIALCALGFLAPLAVANVAHAGIAACGNIHVEAEAQCEVSGGIECEGMCTPVRMEAQCAADLTISCQGECQGELSVTAECSADCEGSCVAECEVDPGSFDCRGQCFGDCNGRASASCSSGDGECLARAEASCEAECSATCTVEPGTADCMAECSGSCEASCEASGTAYLDCQASCQGPQFGECTARLEGGCEASCNADDGALFCDGRYVDHGGNLEECVDSLRGLINASVTYSGSCDSNSCEGSAAFACTCKADDGHFGRNAGLLALGGLFLFGVARRRRR